MLHRFYQIFETGGSLLEKSGLAFVFYLDDILIIGKSYEICVDNIQKISYKNWDL